MEPGGKGGVANPRQFSEAGQGQTAAVKFGEQRLPALRRHPHMPTFVCLQDDRCRTQKRRTSLATTFTMPPYPMALGVTLTSHDLMSRITANRAH